MDSKKSSNMISDIVRLRQIVKKWHKKANNKNNDNIITTTSSPNNGSGSSGNKGMKFLKRTLSFTDISASSTSNDTVPKGFLAVCVGRECKRFRIPTHYLGHQAFGILLREAEEEFGFQQQGILKLPCEVSVFEKVMKIVEEKKDVYFLPPELGFNVHLEKDMIINGFCSPDSGHHPQMCRS
ncbi:hypothetical protein ACFE04_031861 [Oxalis oulophora]